MLTWNSIDAVQESYRSAIRTGQLKYAREPQLPSGSPKVRLWDPYIITPESVRHALLDDEKMDMITKSVESTIKIVPKADEWPAKARKRSLTPEDVRRILLTAFAEPSLKQEPEQDDKLPRPQKIIAEVLRRAEGLKKRRACREAAVLRMTAYALMEVAVVAGEATEVSTIGIALFIALISADRIASTVWSCEKMGKPVSLFCPLLVLGYGKFALVEGSRLAAVFHV